MPPLSGVPAACRYQQSQTIRWKVWQLTPADSSVTSPKIGGDKN